jgi:hypothetical protein
VSGALVGSEKKVTGAMGNMDFEHSGGPSVKGVFGSDLN